MPSSAASAMLSWRPRRWPTGARPWQRSIPYLRFWFRFVLSHQAHIEHGGDPARIYRDLIAPQFDQFVSKPAFEEICQTWVRTQGQTTLLSDSAMVGAWWGSIPQPTPTNPRNQGEAEIDVVAASGNQLVLAGEAKWTRAPLALGVLQHL